MTKKPPPPLSKDNAALLQWKLGRPMTPGLKITVTAEALGALLDAARADEQANMICQQLDAMTQTLRSAPGRAEAEAMAEAAVSPKH